MQSLSPAAVFPVLGPWKGGPSLLARDGSLLLFIEHDGRDPDGLDTDAHLHTTLAARNALAALPASIRVQSYYWHSRATAPTPKRRVLDVVNRVEAERAAHLSGKTLYRTRLLTVLTLPTLAVSARGDFADLITSLFLAPFDRNARQRLKRAVSVGSQHRFLVGEVEQGARRLLESADAYCRRWSTYSGTRVLSAQDAYVWCQALATLDSSALDRRAPAPDDHWYDALLHGEVSSIQWGGVEHLKISEATARHARCASLVRFAERVSPAFWLNEPSALSVPGDFLFACNVRALTALDKTLMFGKVGNELHRAHFSIRRAIGKGAPAGEGRGGESRDADERALERDLDELGAAERMDERWHRAHYVIVALGDDRAAIARTSQALDTAFSLQGVTPVWETPAVLDTYRALQPGALPFDQRALLHNGTQVAAAGLHYRRSNGDFAVRDLGGDEPQAILETIDGSLFAFHPFIGEKATVIGVGPSRSGKTLFKNVLAAHWPKWGGLLALLDYDDGSECLAQLYGEHGALMTGDAGMNPFAAIGDDRTQFQAHFTRLVLAMLSSNDDAAMRTLADGEQRTIDTALDNTLALPAELRTLSSFAGHCPPRLQDKLNRWLRDRGGRYAALLDATIDRVGQIAHPVTAFALRALRDDAAARGPVLLELLWRVTQAFEDTARRALPKKFIVDEAHLALRDPMLAKYLAEKARTWAKYRGSLELWSQHAHEFGDAHDWPALRGAASTFLFTANPEAGEDYRTVFGLTAGDVAEVRGLVPKRDVYLVQPDTGLRKRLILHPDSFALTWASSTAQLAAQRSALIKRDGFASAIATLRDDANASSTAVH